MAKMFNKIFSISLILLLMMSICSWGTSKAYSVKTSQSDSTNEQSINFIDTHPLVFDDLFRRAHWTEESLLPFFSHDPNKNDGPNNWENAAPACGGNHQSPIALNDRDGVFITNRPLKITGLHTVPKSILQQNDGHSVKFIPNYEQGEEVSISGGPLTDEYILQQFHFHWGSTDNHGSEHTLNKRRFANEVHFVFYNSRYRSFDEAAPSPRGLAVVAFFYEVNHSLKGSLLANGLESVINWNDTNTLDMHETFSMGEMIGDVPFDFISYAGSLTTPPCYETVTWIVSTKILQAAPRELEAFRKLKNSSGNQMVNNFRPLQKRNSRKFYYFFDY